MTEGSERKRGNEETRERKELTGSGLAFLTLLYLFSIFLSQASILLVKAWVSD